MTIHLYSFWEKVAEEEWDKHVIDLTKNTCIRDQYFLHFLCWSETKDDFSLRNYTSACLSGSGAQFPFVCISTVTLTKTFIKTVIYVVGDTQKVNI